MTPRQAIKAFVEKYPVEAIASIQQMSNDRSLTTARYNSIALTESADQFETYLEGYVEYKTKGASSGTNNVSNDSIKDSTVKFTGKLFAEKKQMCSKGAEFVNAYLGHLEHLDSDITTRTEAMFNNDSDNDSIGMLTEMTDIYLTSLNEKVDAVMQDLLAISGYTTSQHLKEAARPKPKTTADAVYFL